MAIIPSRGLGLLSQCLWRAARAGRIAAHTGDLDAAQESLRMLLLIESNARTPSLRRSAASAADDLTAALSRYSVSEIAS